TGGGWSGGAVPSPSSPDALLPQASTVPLDFPAMLKASPAAIATTPLNGPSPLTCTGAGWSVGAVPSPSWPEALLPHASTVPSDLRAKLWEPPAAMATTPLPEPRPETDTGVSWSMMVPLPTSPELLLP